MQVNPVIEIRNVCNNLFGIFWPRRKFSRFFPKRRIIIFFRENYRAIFIVSIRMNDAALPIQSACFNFISYRKN